MATDNVRAFLYQPGRLAINPTNIAIGQTFPFGGTSLGYTVDGMELHLDPKITPLRNEAIRGPFDYLWMGYENPPTLTVDLFQWDDDAVSMAFPGLLSTVATTTGSRMVQWPGMTKGTLLSVGVTNVKLLFSPDNTRDGRFALLRSALPMIRESSALALKRKDPMVLPLVFRAMLDVTKTDAQQGLVIGDVRDISL